MIPIEQVIKDAPHGDCLRAAVCSLLDVKDHEAQPNFGALDEWERNHEGEWCVGHDEEQERWWTTLHAWAADRGFVFVQLEAMGDENAKQQWGWFPQDEDLAIAVVPSRRGDWRHCVVANAVEGKVVHDPAGIDDPHSRTGEFLMSDEIIEWLVFFRRLL